MGGQMNLLPFASPAAYPVSLETLRGKRIGLDGESLLKLCLNRYPFEFLENGASKCVCSEILRIVKTISEHARHLTLVFGDSPPESMQKRRRELEYESELVREDALKLLEEGFRNKAAETLRRQKIIPIKVREAVIAAMSRETIDVIEAEIWSAAYMASQKTCGTFDCVVSADSSILLFSPGDVIILHSLECILSSVDYQKMLDFHKISQIQLLKMCLISGTDYFTYSQHCPISRGLRIVKNESKLVNLLKEAPNTKYILFNEALSAYDQAGKVVIKGGDLTPPSSPKLKAQSLAPVFISTPAPKPKKQRRSSSVGHKQKAVPNNKTIDHFFSVVQGRGADLPAIL